MIEYLKSFILGIIEGITEWLPISSTGHMILFNEIIDNTGSFLESQLYLYVIQLGAILAVVTLFFNKLNPFSRKKTPEEKNSTWQMWFKVIVACVPAGVIGLLFNDFMEKFENWQVVSAMLIIYGIAFILVEKLQKKGSVDLSDFPRIITTWGAVSALRSDGVLEIKSISRKDRKPCVPSAAPKIAMMIGLSPDATQTAQQYNLSIPES